MGGRDDDLRQLRGHASEGRSARPNPARRQDAPGTSATRRSDGVCRMERVQRGLAQQSRSGRLRRVKYRSRGGTAKGTAHRIARGRKAGRAVSGRLEGGRSGGTDGTGRPGCFGGRRCRDG
ncbi:uncharacterized protein P884DRAFT_260231 [Thermothelomyces heterothallicus CBS 202.75]|uniref:uncharacterized protein n=1 Tax=Thermothelomyces heterothallicus CBS 202.75 TaxID=1149848 RepID=UPI0037448D9B